MAIVLSVRVCVCVGICLIMPNLIESSIENMHYKNVFTGSIKALNVIFNSFHTQHTKLHSV